MNLKINTKRNYLLCYRWLKWISLFGSCLLFTLAVNGFICSTRGKFTLSKFNVELIPVAALLPETVNKAIMSYIGRICCDINYDNTFLNKMFLCGGCYYLLIFAEMNSLLKLMRNKSTTKEIYIVKRFWGIVGIKRGEATTPSGTIIFLFSALLLFGGVIICGHWRMVNAYKSILLDHGMALSRLESWLDIFSKPPNGCLSAIDADFILSRMRLVYSQLEDSYVYATFHLLGIGSCAIIFGVFGIWGWIMEKCYRTSFPSQKKR